MIPTIFDQILFPLILVLSGILTATRPLLKVFPFLHGLAEFLSRLRTPLGISVLMAGIIELFLLPVLPNHLIRGFSIFLAVVTGLTLTLDMLVSSRHSRGENLPIVWLGNLLLYIRDYSGLLAVVLGFIHPCIV